MSLVCFFMTYILKHLFPVFSALVAIAYSKFTYVTFLFLLKKTILAVSLTVRSHNLYWMT